MQESATARRSGPVIESFNGCNALLELSPAELLQLLRVHFHHTVCSVFSKELSGLDTGIFVQLGIHVVEQH